MHKIVITNMTGARNSGSEALVTSMIHGITQSCGPGTVDIRLESDDAGYDAGVFNGGLSRVHLASRWPPRSWSPGLQRAFYRFAPQVARYVPREQLRTLASLRAADLLVTVGGDVFTSSYGTFAKHARTLQVGRPVALLAQTLGPFTAAEKERFARSLGNVVICTVRESESLAYVAAHFPELEPEQTADVAFLLPSTGRDEARRILEEEHHFPIEGRRLVGLAVSAGIVADRTDEERNAYIREMAAFVDGLNADGYSVVLVPHVRESSARNNDVYACREVLRRCRAPRENLLLSLPVLTAADYKAVIGLCEALVGARTHPTIASLSQGIPTVAVAFSRKAWGIMRDYYGRRLGDALTIDIAEMDRDRLRAAFLTAVANGRTDVTALVMQERAQRNFDRVRDYLAEVPERTA